MGSNRNRDYSNRAQILADHVLAGGGPHVENAASGLAHLQSLTGGFVWPGSSVGGSA